MDRPEFKKTDSLCSSAEDLLLQSVKQNDESAIRKLIREHPNLLSFIYGHPYYNPILYVAIHRFADEVFSDTVQTLIDLGADLFYHREEDDDQEAIHFAVLGGNPSILKTIIKNIRPNNKINSVTSNGATALSLLIQEGDVDSPNFAKCFKVLLDNGIDVNIANLKNETAIVVAARKKYKNVVALLLDSGKFIDIDNYKFRGKSARNLIEENNLYDSPLPDYAANNNILNKSEKLFSYLNVCDEDSFINSEISDVDDAKPEGTLLQFACERNVKRAVQHLLELNADVAKVTPKNPKTPIEIAGENGFWKIFELLLPHYTKIPDGLLNLLLRNSIYEVSTVVNHKKCLKMLLDSDKSFEVNTFLSGNSALHYASKYTNSNIILKLLSRGASLANKNDFDFLPIEDIHPKILNVHFDNCIEITHKPLSDKQSTVITFDYKSLMPTVTAKRNNKVDVESRLIKPEESFTAETDALIELAKNSEHQHLLKHPLITSLLYLKWHKMRMFFYANLIFYCIFVLSLYLHIFIPKTDSYKFANSLILGVLVLTYILLILREFSQITISPTTYFISFENWLELGLVCMVGYIIFESDEDQNIFKQLSAAVILLSALEMMLLIGQHPYLSTNIVIFRTVSFNFFKFLLWYAILILAFVFSFYKLFNKPDETSDKNSTTSENEDKDFFTEPDLTFIKIIVMLTGEFDANSLDFGTMTNKLLFLVFVFLIPIILFNLLNGLAVSDTQTIKNDAETIGYIERINHIVYIENTMLGNIIPSTFLWLLRKCCCCCDSGKCKHRTMLKWLAQKICLFPFTYEDYKMEMLLYQGGKVNRNVQGSCKGLKEIYLDGKTIKRVKDMVRVKNDKENEIEGQYTLQEQVKILQDTINKLISKSCVQCKLCTENGTTCK